MSISKFPTYILLFLLIFSISSCTSSYDSKPSYDEKIYLAESPTPTPSPTATPKPTPTPRPTPKELEPIKRDSNERWFSGGNLQNVTIREWKAGTRDNKIASCADMLSATIWKGHLKTPEDFNRLRLAATKLTNSIDEVSKEINGEMETAMISSEVAVGLMSMTDGFGPNHN